MRTLLALLAATLWAQSPFTGPVTVEKVATGFQFTEGPCWRSDGTLLFSDITADTVYQWTADGAAQVFMKPSGGANGLALDAHSRLLLAQQVQRQVVRREADGSFTLLATHYGGKRLNSPNDLAVKSDGSVWFTDPNYGVAPAQEELGFYGVYRVTGDPKAPELVVSDLKKPNGIVFSPDESKLYVADTDSARVMVYDVSAGKISGGRVFVQKTGDLSPDGLEVDPAGNLYIAGTDGKVWICSPEGALIGSIAVPEKTRNLAWGDSDGKSLYVASGASIYRVRATSGLTVLNAASYAGTAVAPNSLVAAFGAGLAGAKVTVKDAAGAEYPAELLGSAATQVNFIFPAGAALGKATVTAGVASGEVHVESVAPGLFSMNATGSGVAAATGVRIAADGTQSPVTVFECGAAGGSCVAVPIDLGPPDDRIILSLYGTGMRAGQGQATATIGGVFVPVAGPVAQDQYAGLDQVNLGPLPQSLIGRGEVPVVLTVDGKTANSVTVRFR